MGDKLILITGNNHVGKTTLIRNLSETVGAITPVHVNKYDLVPSSLMPKILSMMYDPQAEKYAKESNALLGMSFMLDKLTFEPPEGIWLQDSYWERTIAYCNAHNILNTASSLEENLEHLVHFDATILLSASVASRKQRRENLNLNEDWPPEGSSVSLMDQELERICKNEKEYLFIDTTNFSETEVHDMAYDHIRKVAGWK